MYLLPEAAAREMGERPTERGTLGDEDKARKQYKDENLPIAVRGQPFHGASLRPASCVLRASSAVYAALPPVLFPAAAVGWMVSVRA